MAKKKPLPRWVKDTLDNELDLKALSVIAPQNGMALALARLEAIQALRNHTLNTKGKAISHKEAKGFYERWKKA